MHIRSHRVQQTPERTLPPRPRRSLPPSPPAVTLRPTQVAHPAAHPIARSSLILAARYGPPLQRLRPRNHPFVTLYLLLLSSALQSQRRHSSAALRLLRSSPVFPPTKPRVQRWPGRLRPRDSAPQSPVPEAAVWPKLRSQPAPLTPAL